MQSILLVRLGNVTIIALTKINDHSYVAWASEVSAQLGLERATFISISNGAYILQRWIMYKAYAIDKAIFIVPSGFVNGSFWPSMKRWTLPLVRFMITKKDNHLKSFLQSFVSNEDEFMLRLQKAFLTGLNMDYLGPTLPKEKDVSMFERPVYLLVAEDDVFFPGDKTLARAFQVFKNVRGVYTIKGKLMPGRETYPEIEQTIKS